MGRSAQIAIASEEHALRVLHVGKYFPPHAGGMETYLRDLMVEQQRQGKKVHALVHASKRRLASHRATVEHRGQQLAVTRAGMLGVLLFTPLSPGFAVQMVRLIRQFQPDILHLHVPNISAFWALLMPSARRLPIALHWHADVPRSPHSIGLRLFHAAYRLLERALLRRADAIICTSAAYRDSSTALREFLPKCRVVPLGLDLPLDALPAMAGHAGLSEQAGPAPAALKVLAVGRLTYYKGLEVLLEAVAAQKSVELRIVGSGELRDSLQQRVRELGIDRRVRFLGHVSAGGLDREYAACDCLCLASIERTEAFGLVLLEAMYHGKACVATAVPGSGMGWVVQHERTGLLVPPGDVQGLTAAFKKLAGNRARLAAIGRAGRERFVNQLHIRQSEAGVSDVYATLALPRRAREGPPQGPSR